MSTTRRTPDDDATLLGTVDRMTGAVHLERTLPAAIGVVWDALTDPSRLHAWLAPVKRGAPADAEFVLRMNRTETATCTVTTWDPPRELRLTWDYTGEGVSELRFRPSDADGHTRLTVEHTKIAVDPVQYGAGWHAHVDRLAAPCPVRPAAPTAATTRHSWPPTQRSSPATPRPPTDPVRKPRGGSSSRPRMIPRTRSRW